MDIKNEITTGTTDDLTDLTKLDEQSLLEELRARYEQGIIYTYIGDILISVNPYRDMKLYGKDVSAKYEMSKKSANPPHIFAMADFAYQNMLGLRGETPTNQCILISGESGAGKTESTKLILKQLMELCKSHSQLEQQILQVNPLLEAFGNAQTLMNDNSSRFGKYIQLKYKDKLVKGAKISEYLLEKSRVVFQNSGEENFHIFYYVFAGLPLDQQKMFLLENPEKYRYFSNGAECLENNLTVLKERYHKLCDAMDMVGFTDQEQTDMFKIIAAVLHIGNITFFENEKDAASVVDPDGSLKNVSKLLAIDSLEMMASLTSITMLAREEKVIKNYTIQQAEDARDAMAKAVYGRLFGWIVNRINQLFSQKEQMKQQELMEIGILDIFGFEHFETNSLEQACINVANEQLHFFFNRYVFKLEQEEYMKEGIDWKEIKFLDNQPLLDLFLNKPIGMFALLDEESHFPQATDQTFVQKLDSNFKSSSYYVKSQQETSVTFAINHYAGKVVYDGRNWLEKNRDTQPAGILQILRASDNMLVKAIFLGKITRTGSLTFEQSELNSALKNKASGCPASISKEDKKRKLTVGAQYKNSLMILMEKMNSAVPIFVRCLKPNYLQKPRFCDDQYMLAQLLYTGVLETTKIRREGFAFRPQFSEFVQKYKILVNSSKLAPSKSNCLTILTASKLTGWFIGKTKVFLKLLHVEQLEDLLVRMSKSAVILQRVARGFLARKHYSHRQQKARQATGVLMSFGTDVEKLSCLLYGMQMTLAGYDKDKPADVERKKVPEPTGVTNRAAPSEQADAVLVDDFMISPDSNVSRFGKKGSRGATINWFKQTQFEKVATSGHFSPWFHGVIPRSEAERLLRKTAATGCFLIRVSESRFGYSLSFWDKNRCRHYMVDQLKNGRYVILGEPKAHKTLSNMISYYQQNKISNWDGYLTYPCKQEEGYCDYEELLPHNYIDFSVVGGVKHSEKDSLESPSSRTVSYQESSICSKCMTRDSVREQHPPPTEAELSKDGISSSSSLLCEKELPHTSKGCRRRLIARASHFIGSVSLVNATKSTIMK